MVSRRNFFSICIMMAVILFMFQFLLIIRDAENDYNTNGHLLSETVLEKSDLWNQSSAGASTETVVYIGNSENALSEIVKQWGVYSKRRVVQFGSLEEYDKSGSEKPVLLCIAGSQISTDDEAKLLEALALDGQSIVLCDLPPVEIMKDLSRLQALLGIMEITQDEAKLTGIKLFSGFLLGGEVIYQAKTAEEQEMQDMELSVPWYLTLRGTKTYMVGMMDDTGVENEYLPALIWRNSYGNSQIFAVNGSYMYDQTGLGILDAILYELQDYELHPVVNAQNLSIANCPDFAMENTDELMGIYARNLRRLQMDLMWPNLIACANKGNYKMTCFLAPQLDYTTSEELLFDDLTFYLKQFKEQGAEAGLSLDYLPGVDVSTKAEKDRIFFLNAANQYKYGAAYIKRDDKSMLSELVSQNLLSNLRTVTGIGEDTDPILSYCTDTIVDQAVTANGFTHTYLQDLRVRSIETALGYSNILLDMKRISWPEEDAQYWEVLYKAFSSNINTYWNAFSAFEKTTLSESDERVRSFLAVDYSDTRNGDTIVVELSNRNGDAWFLLRTHAESISDIEGGEYQTIEEDVYLICAQEDVVRITVEPDEQLKFELH